VSATTIGDWLRGKRFPQEIDKILKVLRMIRAAASDLGIDREDSEVAELLNEQRWRAAHWKEARRRADMTSGSVQRVQAARVLVGQLAGRPLTEPNDPFALEVHRPIQPEVPPPDMPVLPTYVPREHDRELERIVAALESKSGIAVLVGGSSTGKEIDSWYSGKAHAPAGNVQALAAPGGIPLWVSDVLPGSTHDLTAARELVLPQARPYLKDLPFLADSGYEGAGKGVLVPVKKPARGELDINTGTRNALLRSLRYQGERGFALMSQRWRVLQHVMVSPSAIGDIAKAASSWCNSSTR
jgi:DDE superfamily endonuclease